GRSTRCHSSTMPVRQSRKSSGIATAPACQRQSIRRAQRGTTERICDLPDDHGPERFASGGFPCFLIDSMRPRNGRKATVSVTSDLDGTSAHYLRDKY